MGLLGFILEGALVDGDCNRDYAQRSATYHEKTGVENWVVTLEVKSGRTHQSLEKKRYHLHHNLNAIIG